jgi:hypothetical protein
MRTILKKKIITVRLELKESLYLLDKGQNLIHPTNFGVYADTQFNQNPLNGFGDGTYRRTERHNTMIILPFSAFRAKNEHERQETTII